jgi:hypothetical protein
MRPEAGNQSSCAHKGYADGREAKDPGSILQRPTRSQALGYRAPMAVRRERTTAVAAVDMMETLMRCPHPQSKDSPTKPLAARK